MPEKTFCLHCHKQFKPKRDDAKFCSDRCAAAWARDHGYHRERFHAEKPEWIKKNCEWCQTIFEYNEYALRGGDRVPKFCSNKCRQAAYRARKAAANEPAGYTGNWDDARNDKRDKGTSQDGKKKWTDGGKTYGFGTDKGTQQESGKGTSQDRENKGTQQPPHNKGTSQEEPIRDSHWHSSDPYEILGVLRTSTKEQIKRAWKKLLRTYHPDVSKHPEAAVITKKINWAWDRIENPTSRTNRR